MSNPKKKLDDLEDTALHLMNAMDEVVLDHLLVEHLTGKSDEIPPPRDKRH